MKYGNNLEGLILSGSNGKHGAVLKAGEFLSNILCKKYGREHRSKILDRIIFGGNNKKFKNPKTDFDWLSRDDKEVQKYIEQAVANRDENNLEYIYRVDGIATNLGIEYKGNMFFKWFKQIKEDEDLYRLLRRSFSKNNIKKTSKKIAIIKVRNMIERKYEDLVRSQIPNTGYF